MMRISVVFRIICFQLLTANASKQAKFEMILDNFQSCSNPNPPLAKKVTLLPKYRVNVVNGKQCLSGNTTISAPTPFLNFSGRTYTVDEAGKRTIRFQITKVSCRNILARALIMYGNISITMRNCMMHEGFYRYENLDLNKISHALPGWQRPGRVVHELQLVTAGATEFCHEIAAHIKVINKI